MDRHWIPAAVALDIALKELGNFAAQRALCKRAHHDLIKTSAQGFSIDSKRQDQVLLPSKFWWAEGHDAMTQDWATGDFSTFIDGKSHWVAFGVSFDLDGVLELVPFDRRARLRLSLSVASDPAWITGLEARRIIHERGGVLETATAGVLIDKCQLGFVPARAVLMQQWTRPDEPSASIGRREWDVPRWFWTDFTSPPHWKADWQRGSFEGHGRRQDKSSWIRLTDTRFQKDALAALYPPPSSDLGRSKTRPIKADVRENRFGRTSGARFLDRFPAENSIRRRKRI